MEKKLKGLVWFGLFIAMMATLSVSADAAEKIFSIKTGNTRVYSNTGLTSGYGWIYDSDEVTINQITATYLKVTYPISRGTKTGYVYPSAFLTKTSGWLTYTSRAKITTYKRPGGATYGYISKNDKVYILGTSGSYTQVKYPVSGGYKYAFIKTSDYNSYIKPAANNNISGGGCHDLSDGWYMIISGNSDDRVLDINNWNRNNGGNLETYAKNNTTNQRFYLHYLNNGYYSIRVLHSGKYIHIQDENNKTSNVHQWEGYNHNNAQWALKPAGNGYYYLQCRGNGSYLDNKSGSTSLGNNVITYPGNGSNAQKWKFVSTSDGSDEKRSLQDGWYEIQCGNNTSYVWDINSASRNNGANLEIYPRHGGDNQRFYLKYLNNGYYAIMAASSYKYMHKQNAGHTDNIVQWEGCSTSAIQTQWAISSAGNGYYYIRAKAGNYADNSGGTVKNGNNIITYYKNGTNAQKWRIVSANANASRQVNSTKRDEVVGYMRNMATITWTPGTSFTHWSGGRTWMAGVYYKGIPYSQSSRNTTLEAFRAKLSGTKYVGPAKKSTYMGSDCSSAVSMAWRKADTSFAITNTSGLLPGNTKISKVGSYTYSSSYGNNTKAACVSNGISKMKNAYKQLKPGDAVVERHKSGSGAAGHVMMVVSVSSTGITVIEQTTYDNTLKSTWRVDKYYSFDALYEKGYLPVKLSTLQ